MNRHEILDQYYSILDREERDPEEIDCRLALLNEEDTDSIKSLISRLPAWTDIFIVNNFPKTLLAYDNVYAFSSKDFFQLPKGTVLYDIIQDNSLNEDFKLNALTQNWHRIKSGGYLILTNITSKDSLEGGVAMDAHAWHEDQKILIYKK
jgi:hypothetical protein